MRPLITGRPQKKLLPGRTGHPALAELNLYPWLGVTDVSHHFDRLVLSEARGVLA
jgi:hypothetical protein